MTIIVENASRPGEPLQKGDMKRERHPTGHVVESLYSPPKKRIDPPPGLNPTANIVSGTLTLRLEDGSLVDVNF